MLKRTCYECKALYYDNYCWKCSLRYSIDSRKGKPLEECPKPKTNKALCDAMCKTSYELQKF